ncbi:acyl-coenzyme A amino acid N-acyltransferase 2-like [Alexandromys fortis]|uniref:acyl-coenzyme A amino acid N-acyltransferase 2-like n=1 Tax=Alexandromys fortis TaxID=100897 RepID=UPI00215326D3|nr:acyl-coenzyme A amino acid N-acyltransferase 2-like [Microtus fortis]
MSSDKAPRGPLTSLPMIQLIVTPSNALADEPVSILATGLPPLQLVTIKATLKDEKGNLFQSRAFYRANEAGEVDLERAAALGGDYVGVHPMGLFWSLKPKRPFQRLMKKEVMNSPFCITLDLYDSVALEDSATIRPKASQIVQRWFVGTGVQRKEIREGRIRGALFLPPGEGPFPGIIDLFGIIGGLIEFRASLLASRGFAVLALAYFAYEGLPDKLLETDLEYFEEAADFLLAHPKIQQPGIGVISVCKGAEIGLAMACYLKQVVATVCINGPNAILHIPLRYRDLVMPPSQWVLEHIQIHASGAMQLRSFIDYSINRLNPQSILPVEKARGWILFIVGENDECLDSKAYAQGAMDQLQSHGRSNGRMLAYPGAGHLIEPPYSPCCFASWTLESANPFLWGGDTIAHAAAQEHSWREIQKFFRQHLSPSGSKL